MFLAGTRRAFPNTSDQLLEMCPMTRGQATPIVIILSDVCWSRSLIQKVFNFLGIWTSIRQPLAKGNRQNTSKQTTRINHPTWLLRRGCKPAIKEQLSDTIFSSQCMQNSTAKSSANLFLLRMRFFRSRPRQALRPGTHDNPFNLAPNARDRAPPTVRRPRGA